MIKNGLIFLFIHFASAKLKRCMFSPGHETCPGTEFLNADSNQIYQQLEQEFYSDIEESEYDVLFNPANLLKNYGINNCNRYSNDQAKQCCNDLNDLQGGDIYQLLDVSGTWRQSGRLVGDFSSDGYYKKCVNDYGNNYVQLVAEIVGTSIPKKVKQCVPKSCGLDELNEFLDRSIKINLLSGNVSAWHYDRIYSPEFIKESYEWNAILGYSVVGLWALFLVVSPLPELNLGSIVENLMSNHQSKTTLKTLNGLRVMSLFWVITGHVWSAGIFYGGARNAIELFQHLGADHPNTIIVLNGTTSVDSFFLIGGLLTGYLMTKIGLKTGDFGWKKMLIAIINRTLRINLTIGALVFMSVTIYSHQGGETINKVGTVLLNGFGGTWAVAQGCYDEWWQPLFNVMVFGENFGTCLGWLWYISNEYWFFLVSVLTTGFMFSGPNRQKYGIGFLGILSVASVTAAIITDFQDVSEFKSVFGAKSREPNHPLQLSDTYFRPWFRASVYFIGFIYGWFLVKKFQQVERETENNKLRKPQQTSVERYVEIFENLCLVFLLAALIYFPLPNYFEAFYPSWIGMLYNSGVRPLWGLVLGHLIYNLEMSNIKYSHASNSWLYNFFANDTWLIFSKLNFSAYLVHYYVIYWVYERIIEEQYYVNWELLGNHSVFIIVYTGLA